MGALKDLRKILSAWETFLRTLCAPPKNLPASCGGPHWAEFKMLCGEMRKVWTRRTRAGAHWRIERHHAGRGPRRKIGTRRGVEATDPMIPGGAARASCRAGWQPEEVPAMADFYASYPLQCIGPPTPELGPRKWREYGRDALGTGIREAQPCAKAIAALV